MPKVLISDKLSESAVEIFKETKVLKHLICLVLKKLRAIKNY